MEPAAEGPEADPDRRADDRLARRASPLRRPASPPGPARTRKKRTKGSARPSLSPDSRLSVWRTDAGTRREVTTAEVTTGSVGERTAPSRKASAQLRSGKSALAGERQQRHRDRHRDHQRPRDRAPVPPQQLALDEHPVGEEGEDQRQLDQLDDRLVGRRRRGRRRRRRGRSRARPRAPRPRARSPASAPESAATTASRPPKSSSASPKPMSIGG